MSTVKEQLYTFVVTVSIQTNGEGFTKIAARGVLRRPNTYRGQTSIMGREHKAVCLLTISPSEGLSIVSQDDINPMKEDSCGL
jgi:hypothetical protein